MTFGKSHFSSINVPARHGAKGDTECLQSSRETSLESPAPEEVSSGHLCVSEAERVENTTDTDILAK